MRFRALSTLLRLAIVLVLSMAALPALGADPTRTGLAAPRAYPGPTLHGELKLALADAIAMGLENNLNVEIQRHAPLIAYEDYRMAWGAYDPEWFSEFGYAEIKDPTANVLAGGRQVISQTRPARRLRGLPRPGPVARGELRAAARRSIDTRTDSPIPGLSPELSSEVCASPSRSR